MFNFQGIAQVAFVAMFQMVHYHVMELIHHQCHYLLLQHSFVHPSSLHLILFDFIVLIKATMITYPHFSIQNQIMHVTCNNILQH
jgi:hypothetical protein